MNKDYYKLNRSKNMSAIRSKNTIPEIKLRKALFKLGYRYRLYLKALPGKPDLVFKSKKAVIFVNGCFWHHHINCSRAFLPHSNLEYWIPKINRNVQRDKENIEKLTNLGWRVLIVWECALKSKLIEKTSTLASNWLMSSIQYAEISYNEEGPYLKIYN